MLAGLYKLLAIGSPSGEADTPSDPSLSFTEQQIYEALSLSDPVNAASALLHVVKQQPDWETVSCLLEFYESLTMDNPSRAEVLTQSLLILRDSPDPPIIFKEGNPSQEPFGVAFDSFLYEVISTALSDPSLDLAITPENSFLVGSVMSAAATKQGLCSSARQIGAVARGIQFPDSTYECSVPQEREVLLLGACLQLLIAGSVFCNRGQLGRNKEQLLPSIKSLPAKNIVKNRNGKRLLQVTIEHAADGFTSDLSSGEAWIVLFPSSA